MVVFVHWISRKPYVIQQEAQREGELSLLFFVFSVSHFIFSRRSEVFSQGLPLVQCVSVSWVRVVKFSRSTLLHCCCLVDSKGFHFLFHCTWQFLYSLKSPTSIQVLIAKRILQKEENVALTHLNVANQNSRNSSLFVQCRSQIIHLNFTQIDSLFSESTFKSNTSMSSNKKRTLARTDSDKVHNLHFKWEDVLNFSGKRYCRIRTSESSKWEVGEKLVKFGWKWKLVKWIDDKFKRKRSPLCFYHLRPWLTLKRESENFWKESSFDHE